MILRAIRFFPLLKLAGERILDLLPRNASYRIHWQLQRRLGVLSNLSPNNVLRELQEIAHFRNLTNYEMDWHVRLFEVGTGWLALAPVVFYLAGAETIVTVDIYNHLRERALKRVLEILGGNLSAVSQAVGVDKREITERYRRIAKNGKLNEILHSCRIDYRAPTRLYDVGLPEASYDLFYSRSVLQRIPNNELKKTLQATYKSLRPGGLSYHVIHHTDHNIRHIRTGQVLKYLGWHDSIYELIQSKRFNYQNRLRHSDFLRIFKEVGFEVSYVDVETLPDSFLENIRLTLRFRRYPRNDLLISKTRILLRKKMNTSG